MKLLLDTNILLDVLLARSPHVDAARRILSAVESGRVTGVSRQSINELLRGRRALSPEMALRFARLYGNSPEFWLNAQRAVDLWDASQARKGEMARIKPLRAA